MFDSAAVAAVGGLVDLGVEVDEVAPIRGERLHVDDRVRHPCRGARDPTGELEGVHVGPLLPDECCDVVHALEVGDGCLFSSPADRPEALVAGELGSIASAGSSLIGCSRAVRTVELGEQSLAELCPGAGAKPASVVERLLGESAGAIGVPQCERQDGCRVRERAGEGDDGAVDTAVTGEWFDLVQQLLAEHMMVESDCGFGEVADEH